MTESLQAQIDQLKTALETLKAQRAVLGDAISPAIQATEEKLARLQTASAHKPTDDERRQITLFFSDVVGSVALAEQLDPEDWRNIIGTVQYKIGSIVTARGGMIAQYQGDGLIAFFGAKGLREQDVEQAVHAALESQKAISQLSLSVALQIRIGIHTGLVLLGSWGAESKIEFAAFGDAVNTAARLQSIAPPGSVLISYETHQYIRGAFEFTPLAPIVLKGKSAPVQTFLVERAKPRSFRIHARGVAGIQTRTIGREHELQVLRGGFRAALEQRRAVWMQLIGEPGVGKSRLVDETNEWARQRSETLVSLRGRAFAGEQNQPFALVRRIWFDSFQIAEDAPLAAAQTQWVERFRDLTGIADKEPAHALGRLIGLPFDESPYTDALYNDPEQVRGRAFVVSRAALRAILATRPMQILLEDLHWADVSSIDYLQQVVLQELDAPAHAQPLEGLFVLATARPEWQGFSGEQVTQINLAPLSANATEQLAHELLQNVAGITEEGVRLIVERAEGVPYFVEELVNYFLDRGIIDREQEPWRFIPERLQALHGSSKTPLPATLQYLLRARLDALTLLERSALQRGSVYGRQFWSGGVNALGVPHSERILPGLEPRGLVARHNESALEGEREWSFHHALLRDVTYDSLLKRERPALHQKAAEWLEGKAQESGRLDEFAGLLGEHREQSGDLPAAASWYLRAGERANRQGAAPEGRRFFDRALELVSPSDLHARWRALSGREGALGRLGERGLQLDDIRTLMELAEELNEDGRRAQAFYNHARYLVAGGELQSAVVSAEKALNAARRVDHIGLQAQALMSMIASRTRLGEPEQARAFVTQARESARASGDEFIYAQTLMQIGLHYTDASDLAEAVEPYKQAAELASTLGNRALEGQTLSNLGYCYAQLGLYALARPALEKTMELAASVGEWRDYAYGLQNLGWTYLCSRDEAAARKLEEQALAEFSRIGDGFGHAASVLYLGHIAERTGDASEGARQFAAALDQFSRIGVRGFMMDSRAGLARCAQAQGDMDSAELHVTRLWKYLSENGTQGIELPTLVYQTCANLFSALEQTENARHAVEAGYRELITRAEKISNAEWRTSFLVNVLEHRTMVEMWARMNLTAPHHAGSPGPLAIE